jgi:hypothetical protein
MLATEVPVPLWSFDAPLVRGSGNDPKLQALATVEVGRKCEAKGRVGRSISREAEARAQFLLRLDTSNTPLERTGPQQFTSGQPSTPACHSWAAFEESNPYVMLTQLDHFHILL